MNLRAYLDEREIALDAFAGTVGVSVQAIHRYIRGERIPHRDVMQRIIAATNGAVQANDFFATPTTAPSEQVAA